MFISTFNCIRIHFKYSFIKIFTLISIFCTFTLLYQIIYYSIHLFYISMFHYHHSSIFIIPIRICIRIGYMNREHLDGNGFSSTLINEYSFSYFIKWIYSKYFQIDQICIYPLNSLNCHYEFFRYNYKFLLHALS